MHRKRWQPSHSDVDPEHRPHIRWRRSSRGQRFRRGTLHRAWRRPPRAPPVRGCTSTGGGTKRSQQRRCTTRRCWRSGSSSCFRRSLGSSWSCCSQSCCSYGSGHSQRTPGRLRSCFEKSQAAIPILEHTNSRPQRIWQSTTVRRLTRAMKPQARTCWWRCCVRQSILCRCSSLSRRSLRCTVRLHSHRISHRLAR